ncbi:inositol polyphosphate phosphatase [Schizosaccharomyces japonicus yFS275]|uniref:Inositol polyphosphate phosphatase n=1 Tax=Schizosaccharomyces japonicus (strain yFS275 / FY16936) TaxID=402676 RepID=B6K0Y8_SCHJY|nr:inositol polyphosphate phosphatase [Schizosaccharomyces japonicus yFS275]EEB07609.2 inositol polyphosphate phosphatase [Schizosaccharomyces japonicus yFS275]
MDVLYSYIQKSIGPPHPHYHPTNPHTDPTVLVGRGFTQLQSCTVCGRLYRKVNCSVQFPCIFAMQLDVFETADSIQLHDTKRNAILEISRVNGNIGVSQARKPPNVTSKPAICLYGIIPLKLTKYLILVRKASHVASIASHEIYEATSFAVVPLMMTLAILRDETEQQLLRLLKRHLSNGHIYFSPTTNLTNTFQRNAEGYGSQPFWRHANPSFFWNKYACSSLMTSAEQNPLVNDWIVPMIHGFVSVRNVFIRTHTVELGIITRRSIYRAGTRYFSRGIDTAGDVANFNETETTLFLESLHEPTENRILMVYVQIRGSIPLFWYEVNDLRYYPRLHCASSLLSEDAAQRHFYKLRETYNGRIVVVNLIKESGREKPLKLAFESVLNKLDNPDVDYRYVDYQKECGGLPNQALLYFTSKFEDDFKEPTYFLVKGNTVVRRQTVFMRTNCMDCLDRTNLVQSFFSRFVITQQLRDVGLLTTTQTLADFPEFVTNFQQLWVANGDSVSTSYARTPALRSDVTQYGKRTLKGLYNDLVSSLKRYINNNFYDGMEQDSYDLGLGNYIPSLSTDSRLFVDTRPWPIRCAPLFLALTCLFSLADVLSVGINPFRLTLWGISLGCWLSIILVYRSYYVNWPILNRPSFLDTELTATLTSWNPLTKLRLVWLRLRRTGKDE